MTPPPTPPKRFVTYCRVSTQRQGESGLGLESQASAVSRYVEFNGGEVLGSFVETESGKKATNRPQLLAAMELCRKTKATLLIAKLDRLARNVHFISGLLESGVDFVAADAPSKDRFMLHVQAAFAEEEARRISLRTKEALAAAKARGVVIGATGRALALRHAAEAQERALGYEALFRQVAGEGIYTTKDFFREFEGRRLESCHSENVENHFVTQEKLTGSEQKLEHVHHRSTVSGIVCSFPIHPLPAWRAAVPAAVRSSPKQPAPAHPAHPAHPEHPEHPEHPAPPCRQPRRPPPRATAHAAPTGRAIQTPIRGSSPRSGSVQQQCIRAAGGSRASPKSHLASASCPDTLLHVRRH